MNLDFLTHVFKKEQNTALGIDIGASSIKVVQVSKKDNAIVLDTYGELSLGPYGNTSVGEATRLSPEKVAEALVALLTEKEVNITAKVAGFAVPFESSLMTTFSLPQVAAKDLATAVPIEARKYIPVPISEVTLDWSVIESERDPDDPVDSNGSKSKQPQAEILLVAIHNDILSDYQMIANKTKLDVRFFEIEIFSALRSIIKDEKEPVLMIDMGALNTKVYIMEEGIMRASHTINIGAQDITRSIAEGLHINFDQAEIVKRDIGLGKTENGTDIQDIVHVPLERMFSLINRIMFNFSQKQHKTLKKGFLVGGGSALKGIEAYATDMLKTKMVMGNPFIKLETPAFIDEVLAKTGPEFVVAVGVAIRALSEA